MDLSQDVLSNYLIKKEINTQCININTIKYHRKFGEHSSFPARIIRILVSNYSRFVVLRKLDLKVCITSLQSIIILIVL